MAFTETRKAFWESMTNTPRIVGQELRSDTMSARRSLNDLRERESSLLPAEQTQLLDLQNRMGEFGQSTDTARREELLRSSLEPQQKMNEFGYEKDVLSNKLGKYGFNKIDLNDDASIINAGLDPEKIKAGLSNSDYNEPYRFVDKDGNKLISAADPALLETRALQFGKGEFGKSFIDIETDLYKKEREAEINARYGKKQGADDGFIDSVAKDYIKLFNNKEASPEQRLAAGKFIHANFGKYGNYVDPVQLNAVLKAEDIEPASSGKEVVSSKKEAPGFWEGLFGSSKKDELSK